VAFIQKQPSSSSSDAPQKLLMITWRPEIFFLKKSSNFKHAARVRNKKEQKISTKP
jgi:hypothetical protein